jgi:hypothetical protein
MGRLFILYIFLGSHTKLFVTWYYNYNLCSFQIFAFYLIACTLLSDRNDRTHIFTGNYTEFFKPNF